MQKSESQCADLLQAQEEPASDLGADRRCWRPDIGRRRRETDGRARAGEGTVTLYKNPQCGCCEGYADYLRDNGFVVKVIPSHDLLVMGQKYGIPDADAPCHIAVIGDYVVGGHMPIEVVNRLLSEKPKIIGINLPGMPTGTPGMPGPKMQLTIYEIGQKPPKVYAVV